VSEGPVTPEEPVLPARTGDERDDGWGDAPAEDRDDLARFRADRPPHHGE
jgi:hypothetical protein